MSLIKKRKKTEKISYKDSYFLFGNRWFIKTQEDGVIGVRALNENDQVPAEYVESWNDVNSVSPKYDSIKISYVKMNRSSYN
jgi:hypothetical protein